MKAPLQVMKFGGTSVGDASCITRTAQIIAKAARTRPCIAVVSAMSGVTNRLIDAAKRAAEGDTQAGAAIVAALQTQHETALASLVANEAARKGVREKMNAVLAEGKRLCDGT